jgi:predicted Ser/Thr protein kinase
MGEPLIGPLFVGGTNVSFVEAERRAFGCYLYPYLLFNSQWYENFNNYRDFGSEYIEIVLAHLPSTWITRPTGIWYQAWPAAETLPAEGFKIHISATPETAPEVLQRVAPILAGLEVAFKFAIDSRILAILTSKTFPRELSGKFVTVYAADTTQFRKLVKQLCEATLPCVGPYILSDKRCKGSKVVFYRYGGFGQNVQVNMYGELVPVIACGTNSVIEDVRTPFCRFPEGIEDPLQDDADESGPGAEEIVLHNRYRIDEAVSFTNAGGVYRATDMSDGSSVILKEARPHVGTDFFHTADVISGLERERDILERLKGLQCVPQIVDFFTEWEHAFLAMRFVDGFPLPSFQSQEETGLLTARVTTRATLERFSEIFMTLSRNLLSAVEACHRAGVVLGDLAPQNVIVDPLTLAVTLVDFESAYVEEQKEIGRAFTPGFVLPHVMAGGRPSFKDDHYALRRLLCSIVYPIQSLSVISERAEQELLKAVVRDHGLPAHIKRFLYGLIEAPKDQCVREIERECSGMDSWEKDQRESDQLISAQELAKAIGDIASYIKATASPTRLDRLWPSDYRAFSAHPLSLAYGTLGIALFLLAAEENIPQYAREWIESCVINPEKSGAGFFTGLAGIAWGLWSMGYQERAINVSRAITARKRQARLDDLFFGTAGIGLSQLFLWQATKQSAFIEQLCEMADELCKNAQISRNGECWPHADGIAYNGLAHGGSGIALFLLMASEAAGEPEYRTHACAGLEHVIAEASDRDDCIAWTRFPEDTFLWPYWRSGTAGIGSVLIRFFAITRDERYKQLAIKAARYLAHRYTLMPGQFNGLSGIGEFFIDMYRHTRDPLYLEKAGWIARRALLFAVEERIGTAFPGEELLRISNDFGTGGAGIGMFLSRLARLRPHPFLDGFEYHLESRISSDGAPILSGHKIVV